MRRPTTTARRLAHLEQRRPIAAVTVMRTVREATDPMPEDRPGILHIVRTIIDPVPLCVH